jgi:hypothetical protein
MERAATEVITGIFGKLQWRQIGVKIKKNVKLNIVKILIFL